MKFIVGKLGRQQRAKRGNLCGWIKSKRRDTYFLYVGRCRVVNSSRAWRWLMGSKTTVRGSLVSCSGAGGRTCERSGRESYSDSSQALIFDAQRQYTISKVKFDLYQRSYRPRTWSFSCGPCLDRTFYVWVWSTQSGYLWSLSLWGPRASPELVRFTMYSPFFCLQMCEWTLEFVDWLIPDKNYNYHTYILSCLNTLKYVSQ